MHHTGDFIPNLLTDPLLWVSILAMALCIRQARRYGLNVFLWGTLGFLFGPITLLALHITKRFRTSAVTNQVSAPKAISAEPLEVRAAPVLQDPRTLGWYYVDATRQPVGPISLEELAPLFHQRILGSDSLVWHPEMTDWSEASRVPMLGSLLEIEILSATPTSSC
jgi:hypothetical protein